MTVSTMAVTVRASEDVPNDQTAPGVPKVPTLLQVTSGSQSLRFERVMVTNVNVYGESSPSPEVTLQVAANSVITVSQIETKYPGPYPGKPYGFNVYATTGASGTETKQNTLPIPSGQTWQEPVTGLIVGSALPTAVAPMPAFVTNANTVNNPPATGLITVAQSPAGTVNPVTGRTNEATATYMAASLNILNVGTQPPPTGNLPH